MRIFLRETAPVVTSEHVGPENLRHAENRSPNDDESDVKNKNSPERAGVGSLRHVFEHNNSSPKRVEPENLRHEESRPKSDNTRSPKRERDIKSDSSPKRVGSEYLKHVESRRTDNKRVIKSNNNSPQHVGPQNIRHVEHRAHGSERDIKSQTSPERVGPQNLRQAEHRPDNDESIDEMNSTTELLYKTPVKPRKSEVWDVSEPEKAVIGPHLLRPSGGRKLSGGSAAPGTPTTAPCTPTSPASPPRSSIPSPTSNDDKPAQEPKKPRQFQTSFTGASHFDFLMQQKIKEKRRKEKERLARESLTRHHAISAELDKANELKKKNEEDRLKKKEAAIHIHSYGVRGN
jgi:hypothetical protein